jgi:hypothetical protein
VAGTQHHFCFDEAECAWPNLRLAQSAAGDVKFFECDLRIDIDHRLEVVLQVVPNAAGHMRLRLFRGDKEVRSGEWAFPIRNRDRAIPFH